MSFCITFGSSFAKQNRSCFVFSVFSFVLHALLATKYAKMSKAQNIHDIVYFRTQKHCSRQEQLLLDNSNKKHWFLNIYNVHNQWFRTLNRSCLGQAFDRFKKNAGKKETQTREPSAGTKMHEWAHCNGNGKLDRANIVWYWKITMLTHDFDKSTRTCSKNFIARRENVFLKRHFHTDLEQSLGELFSPLGCL